MTRSRQTADWGSRAGLAKIIPSSVAVGSGTGSADSLGTVTFTTASSVSLNNIFSSTYDNYLIEIRWQQNTTAGTPSWRFRGSGSDITTGYYAGSYGYKSDNSAAWQATSNASSQNFIDGTNSKADGGSNLFDLTIFNALSTVRKNYHYEVGHWRDNDVWVYQGGSGFNSSSTVADGITISTSAGTFTGQILVYGYTK